MRLIKNIAANAEILLWVSALLGFLMKTQAITGGTLILNASLGLLVSLYLAYVVVPLENVEPSKYPLGRKILRAGIYLISACTVGSLLMKLSMQAYADLYLERSFIVFALLLIALLYRYRVVQSMLWASHYFDMVRRSIFILSTAFLFYVTPLEKFAKLYYKENPAYAQALIQHLRNPENKAYQLELQKAEKELKK